MKFTNGLWLMRKEIDPSFAVQYADHRVNGNELIVYAATSRVTNRSQGVGGSVITVRFTSPMEDVIRVAVSHYEGAVEKGPRAKVNDTAPEVTVTETEEQLVFTSGKTSAVIEKGIGAWAVRFMDGDRKLTSSGFRAEGHMRNGETGRVYTTEQLGIDVDEYVYGLGERFTPFVKNGQTVEIWQADGGTASEQAYKNIPFYVTNKGYGILVDDEGDVQFEICSEKVGRVCMSAEGERFSYYVINGRTPKGTVQKYTELTGKPALPPAWSFGLWLSTSFTTKYNEETTSSFIQGMKDRDIPLSVFHFDCFWMKGYEWCNFEWDNEVFPDPEDMIRRYHERGLKICVWINSYIGQKSPLFDEAMKNGYLIKKANGDVWQSDLWQPGMGEVDFTNPEARAWYREKLRRLLRMGVDCFKTDFGERIPVRDIVYYDGSDPVKMHNYYTHLYNEAVFSLLKEERGEGEAVVFARSATVGGQQFPVHWGGDCSADYVSMAETLRGGLSLALSGFGFWSHDISGFESTATPDLYKRWCQFGLLSSHSRLHGSTSYRVPWLFDDEASDVVRKFTRLKCTLMPYLYQAAVESHTIGTPMLRPMFVEFPEEKACDTLDRQYMFGEDLLVAPIFKASGEVDYYLPQGRWINLLTGEAKDGGTWQHEKHDYMSLPLMVRPNTILPMGTVDDRPDYDYASNLAVYLSEFDDGAKAETIVPDLKGQPVLKLTAKRSGSVIDVAVKQMRGKDREIALPEVKLLPGCAFSGEIRVK